MPDATTETVATSARSPLVESITFGWWNTSLSPIGRDRSDDDHKETSKKIVQFLIDDLNVDCLALGEVTGNDLQSLKEACQSPALEVYEGTMKEGRLQFDTGIIYNSNRLFLADSKSVTAAHGFRNYKIMNRADFISTSDGCSFHVFASHWPSRGTSEETILTRKTIAGRLKEQINEVELFTSDALVVVLGDFNDEPFDESLAWHLLATRDRQLAKTRPGYLYNPFWKHLGESIPHTHSEQRHGAAGSYFYRGGTNTRWWTFDQILFSPAFLGNSAWSLNEEKTLILENQHLVNLVQNDEVHFDHLPVLSVVERVIKPI